MPQCAGVLAKALGYRWQEHAERLIKPMKLTGLSEQLIQAYKVSFWRLGYDYGNFRRSSGK